MAESQTHQTIADQVGRTLILLSGVELIAEVVAK